MSTQHNTIASYECKVSQRCRYCGLVIVPVSSSLDSPGSNETDWQTVDGSNWCKQAGAKHATMAEWADITGKLKAEIPFDNRPPVFRFESVYHEHPYQYHQPQRDDLTRAA